MEIITLGGGERSNAGGLQEKIGQPSVKPAFTWILALNRGLDLMALYRTLPTPLCYDSKPSRNKQAGTGQDCIQ